MEVIQAPDRYQLADLVARDCSFPLFNAVEILEKCCSLQQMYSYSRSMIGRTADYKQVSGSTASHAINFKAPSVAVLVSDTFGLEEATLFWNLRASGMSAAWLSFVQLEAELDVVAAWLCSDYGGVFYGNLKPSGIVFSPANDAADRLVPIMQELYTALPDYVPAFPIVSRADLIAYHLRRPAITSEPLSVTEDDGACAFVPVIPQVTGALTFVLSGAA